MRLNRFEEDVFFSTARITFQKDESRGASIGTAFFCRVPFVDGRFAFLLISNKHVFCNPKGPIQFSFTRAAADGRPELGNIQTFDLPNYERSLLVHSDPDVDLACINISDLIGGTNGLFVKAIEPDLISDFSEDWVPGQEVWFVGYPENRFDVKHNLPLLRKGSIASMPTVNFNGNEQIVVDAQVFPGSSGSPVFAAFKGSFKMIGVVSQTMVRYGELSTLPADHSGLTVPQMMGLGIIIKSTAVQTLIDQVAIRVAEMNHGLERFKTLKKGLGQNAKRVL